MSKVQVKFIKFNANKFEEGRSGRKMVIDGRINLIYIFKKL